VYSRRVHCCVPWGIRPGVAVWLRETRILGIGRVLVVAGIRLRLRRQSVARQGVCAAVPFFGNGCFGSCVGLPVFVLVAGLGELGADGLAGALEHGGEGVGADVEAVQDFEVCVAEGAPFLVAGEEWLAGAGFGLPAGCGCAGGVVEVVVVPGEWWWPAVLLGVLAGLCGWSGGHGELVVELGDVVSGVWWCVSGEGLGELGGCPAEFVGEGVGVPADGGEGL